MPKIKKRTISVFFITLIVLYIIIKVTPSLTGALTGTETAEYGNLEISDKVTCYIIRDETVYTAADKEKIKYFIKEGTQIKKGANVLEATKVSGESKDTDNKDLISDLKNNVKEDSANHTSQRKGVFSFYVDGYEDYFTPKTMTELDKEKTESLDIEAKNIKADETAEKGDPIFKITNNSMWYIAFWIDKEDITKYEVGNPVTAKMNDEEIECTVNNIEKTKDGWLVILSTNRYYSGFSKDRVVEAEIVTTDLEGILVSNKSITTKDDQVGVYVKKATGDYEFVPVQVLGSDGETTVITEGIYYDDEGQQVETVNNYDEIKTNPKSEE